MLLDESTDLVPVARRLLDELVEEIERRLEIFTPVYAAVALEAQHVRLSLCLDNVAGAVLRRYFRHENE